MVRARQRHILSFLGLTLAFFLAGCGASATQSKQATPPASPTPVQAQQLLQNTDHQLTTAKTLHGIFNLTISGQTINGTTSSEVWNEQPSNSRTIVQRSTVAQIATGTTSVSNGKQLWLYDPQKKVVYNGPASANSNSASGLGRQNQLLSFVRTVFTRSTGTLGSPTSVNGHNTYDVHVVPQSTTSAGTDNYDYNGDVYIDRSTQLPVRVKLTIQNIGQVQLDFANLTLNQPVASQLFTFTVPTSAKVLPFPTTNSSTGTLSVSQAEQQAGYHLLSIPVGHGYTLQSIAALGAPGNQIYTLTYLRGTTQLTIAEGKPLANLPSSGQQVSLRGSSAELSSENGATTLAWTEKGVGIHVTGQLSSQQITEVAQQLV